jgi:tetratricopeptide (TPR) repeat protein
MPSHIFTRLGLWDESIEANLASAAAARRVVARDHPGTTAFDELHALDYLEYAYLQEGRDAEATGVLEQVRKVETLNVPQFAAAYALAAVGARHALERGDWTEAAGLTLGPSSFPWDRFPHAVAIVEYARAVGAARLGDAARAQAARARLQQLHDVIVARKDAYWAAQVEILIGEAAAVQAQVDGKRDEALRLLREAARLEDGSEKSPVTPGAILPAREMLADLLGERGDPTGALAEYDAVLKVAPGRYRSLAGAARAAEAAGDAARARTYQTRLVAQCGRADPARADVGRARAALAATAPR